MFRNNWIRVPFIASAMWIVPQLFLSLVHPGPFHPWRIIILGLVFGFSIQIFNWLRVRDRFGKAEQQFSSPRQKRALMLMQDKVRALVTCEKAIESMPKLRLRSVNAELGKIVARSKIRRVAWGFTWGESMSVDIIELGEHLTEVRIESRPTVRTVLVDGGESWTNIEQLVSEIKKLDVDPSRAVLNDGAELLQDLTTRPVTFSREH